jgi:hypothetical protein
MNLCILVEVFGDARDGCLDAAGMGIPACMFVCVYSCMYDISVLGLYMYRNTDISTPKQASKRCS